MNSLNFPIGNSQLPDQVHRVLLNLSEPMLVAQIRIPASSRCFRAVHLW